MPVEPRARLLHGVAVLDAVNDVGQDQSSRMRRIVMLPALYATPVRATIFANDASLLRTDTSMHVTHDPAADRVADHRLQHLPRGRYPRRHHRRRRSRSRRRASRPGRAVDRLRAGDRRAQELERADHRKPLHARGAGRAAGRRRRQLRPRARSAKFVTRGADARLSRCETARSCWSQPEHAGAERRRGCSSTRAIQPQRRMAAGGAP